jgi:hypothetical protein
MQAQGSRSHEPLFLELRGTKRPRHMQHTPGKFSCNTVNLCWHSFSFCIFSELVRGYSTDSILIALTYEAMAPFCFSFTGTGRCVIRLHMMRIPSQGWGQGVMRLFTLGNESEDTQYSKDGEKISSAAQTLMHHSERTRWLSTRKSILISLTPWPT